MRKAKPFFAVLALECLTRNAPKDQRVKMSQLEQFLMEKANLSKEMASQAVHNLLEDEIIVKVVDNRKNGKPHGCQVIQMLNNDHIEILDKDCYCFECFLPGELIKCRRCPRAFHLSCVRKYPERPNYAVPATNIIDEYEDESDNEVSPTSLLQPTPLQITSTNSGVQLLPKVRPCHVVLIDVMRTSLDSKDFKIEIENNSHDERKPEIPDVLFMGEVRPPTRQRSNLSVTPNWLKNESTASRDIFETRVYLCTCCRLLENGQLTQPPNLLIDEMHHLLSYGFKRSRAWMKRDIYKQLDYLKLPQKLIKVIIKKLFQRHPIMTLDTIDYKIKNKKYTLLVEILIDFLEFQFAIGVLFGSSSLIFDCSKYSVRHLSYDIAELKRCPDCYRHSNDRLTPFWFALPCMQRHELVFAKCPGHSYWPAKVVRVLRNAAKYDVRFFGGNHERSLIDSKKIQPIDALNIPFPKLLSFQEAMHEMQCYQTLAQYPPKRFCYQTNQDDLKEIIENIMGALIADYEKPITSTKRQKALKRNALNQTLPNLKSMSENEAESEACSSKRAIQNIKPRLVKRKSNTLPKLMRLENSSNVNSPASVISTPTSVSVTPNNYMTGSITIEQHIAEMNALREQLHELHQRELFIAKSKPYCVKCLQPAKFLCCIHAWYCSKVCQRQHWYEVHDMQCDNNTNNGC